MKKYIKPETAKVDIYDDSICSNDMIVSSFQIIQKQAAAIEDADDVLSKKDVWDMDW